MPCPVKPFESKDPYSRVGLHEEYGATIVYKALPASSRGEVAVLRHLDAKHGHHLMQIHAIKSQSLMRLLPDPDARVDQSICDPHPSWCSAIQQSYSFVYGNGETSAAQKRRDPSNLNRYTCSTRNVHSTIKRVRVMQYAS
jgi:hypothetical protein